jgi:pimeloyl-ACP methyl ester carboxylesterase
MKTTTNTLLINGVTYYYERHGHGAPLLLLHGGLGSIDMFRDHVLPALARTHEVIAVDLHGHGRTRLGDRKISLIDMGDDMAVLVAKLGFRQVDAMGYSLGAGVAFRFAVQHPACVRRLVLVSAGYSQAGFYPEMLPMQAALDAGMAPMMKDTPMYTSYVAVAPEPAEFPQLLDRLGEYMRQPYDWADDVTQLATTTVEAMLVCGDSDMFRLDHMVEFYKLLGGGQRDAGWQREHMSKHRLAILPNVTHYDMFLSPALVPTVLPFLDGNDAAARWT